MNNMLMEAPKFWLTEDNLLAGVKQKNGYKVTIHYLIHQL